MMTRRSLGLWASLAIGFSLWVLIFILLMGVEARLAAVPAPVPSFSTANK